jgi:hypothetical protein
MKIKKEILLGSIALTAVIASICIISCNKETTLPGTKPNLPGARNGNPTVQTQNSLVAQKAYLAAFNPSGTCSGGPIVTHNASVSYFNPTTGASQTTVNDALCYATGISWNSTNCILYFTVGTSTQGYSNLWKINSDGSATQLGAITKDGTNPLYVEEMEIDQAGDMYILGPGTTTNIDLWKIAYGNLGNSTITATDIGTTFTNSHSQSYMESLSYNANIASNNLYCTWEVSNNSTTTYVATISKTTGAVGTPVTYTGLSPNTSDFATYYYSGTLYFAKGGTLYSLVSGTATNVGSLTMSTTNDMTFRGTCSL